MTVTSLLWIGAHPDDEALAAPILASVCLDRGAACSLLVFTRGEMGSCGLAGGCKPDLASVRSGEMAYASQYLRSELFLLALPDGGGISPPPWSDDSRNQALVARLARIISAIAPEAILTFDPRHGSTCHPDHMAVGQLVLEAIAQLEAKPAVYFLETRLTVDSSPFTLHFTSAVASDHVIDRYEANQDLYTTGNAAWQSISDVMQRHPSQFDSMWIDAVQNVPLPDRAVFYASSVVAGDPLAQGCR
jgi:LmbE family N-acetylglucosaminyl deacetylase